MLWLYEILETLINFVSQVELWLVASVAVLIGAAAYILHLTQTAQTSPLWVVRKGECPFCGNALFGTTSAYQRLNFLDTVVPEDQYLCIDCDQEKVSDLLSLLEDGR